MNYINIYIYNGLELTIKLVIFETKILKRSKKSPFSRKKFQEIQVKQKKD